MIKFLNNLIVRQVDIIVDVQNVIVYQEID